MLKVADLYASLDAEELAALFPYGSYVLINRIGAEDEDFVQQRRNLERFVSGERLLLDSHARRILLGKLSRDQAVSLLDYVKREPGVDPFTELERFADAPTSEELDSLLSWFGLTRPDVPQAEQEYDPVASVESVEPSHALYDYQRQALEEIKAIFARNSRAVLHMPTGSGKTRTAMALAADHLRQKEDALVVWLADTLELCRQAREEFKETWYCVGNQTVSLYSYMEGIKPDLKEIQSGFLVMTLGAAAAALRAEINKGIESISALAMKRPLVIFDEAHKATANKFGRVFQTLARREGAKMLGLTATPGRTTESSAENAKLVALFEHKVTLKVDGYESVIDYLQKEGYLARPTFRSVPSPFDFAQFKLNQDEELSEERMRTILRLVAEDTDRSILVFEEVKRLVSEGHKRILLFAASVEQAHRLAYVLDFFGTDPQAKMPYRARAVSSGHTSLGERQQAVRWFLEPVAVKGDVRILCNYGILTTGFDAPETSAVVIARPTTSLVLYSQMVGRGLRGPRSHGTAEVQIVTIIDRNLPKFWDVAALFNNWNEDWSPIKRK